MGDGRLVGGWSFFVGRWLSMVGEMLMISRRVSVMVSSLVGIIFIEFFPPGKCGVLCIVFILFIDLYI